MLNIFKVILLAAALSFAIASYAERQPQSALDSLELKAEDTMNNTKEIKYSSLLPVE